MSIVSVQPKSFILALFIRDDNERFLLGDNGYDFKDSQLHFAANTIENDEVQKQGADGVMIAGQVRRASVQSFDGYVGDATMAKETIEQMRRDFIAFFLKGHHYRVIYVDCNRNAWQRKGGYLVDAPEVKELWQIHPEYHVGLNFEDVNYYSYDEDADGNEILANLVNVPVSTEAEGGLVWDEDGAVSEDAGDIYYDTAESSASGKSIAISDAAEAPLASFQLDGETSQNGTPTPDAPVPVKVVTGLNVVKICGKNLFDIGASLDEWFQTFQNGLTINSYSINRTTATILGEKLTIDSYDTAGWTWISKWVLLEKNTRYIISGKNTQAIRIVGFNSKEVSTAGTLIATKNKAQDGGTATFDTGDYNYYAISFYPNGVNDYFEDIQIEKGSEATAYEPYQGQSYEVNLASKNLLDITTLTYGYVLGGGGFANTHAYGEMRSRYIKVDPSTTYTFSIVETSSSYESWFGIGEYSAYNSGFIIRQTQSTSGATSFTFTTSANCRYVVLSARNLEAATKVQFEKASTPTSWEAFWQIELCGLGDDGAGGYLYQDYIYKNLTDNKWYVRKEVGEHLFDGSENWWESGAQTDNVYQVATGGYAGVPVSAGYSDSLEIITTTAWYAERLPNKAVFTSNNIYVRVSQSLASTLEQFKAWLAASTPTIYYALATPTDTEITNEALIEQLEALLTTARTYYGINNIFTITPNEQGTLEIGYYTKYQPMVGSGGYVWEAGGADGPTVIINNSIDSVSPVWTIYGPTTNPQLENATTGETIEYVGTIAQGQTLTIDMGEQTASLDGLNVISNLVGDFIQLAPGRNNIIYSVSGEAGASELGWSEIVG